MPILVYPYTETDHLVAETGVLVEKSTKPVTDPVGTSFESRSSPWTWTFSKTTSPAIAIAYEEWLNSREFSDLVLYCWLGVSAVFPNVTNGESVDCKRRVISWWSQSRGDLRLHLGLSRMNRHLRYFSIDQSRMELGQLPTGRTPHEHFEPLGAWFSAGARSQVQAPAGLAPRVNISIQ